MRARCRAWTYEQVRYTLGLIKSHEPAISSPPAPTPHWTLHLTLRFTCNITCDDGWPHDGLPVSCVPCVLHPHPWNCLVAIGNAVCCAELSGRPTRSIERARRPAISVSASLSLAVSSPPLSLPVPLAAIVDARPDHVLVLPIVAGSHWRLPTPVPPCISCRHAPTPSTCTTAPRTDTAPTLSMGRRRLKANERRGSRRRSTRPAWSRRLIRSRATS